MIENPENRRQQQQQPISPSQEGGPYSGGARAMQVGPASTRTSRVTIFRARQKRRQPKSWMTKRGHWRANCVVLLAPWRRWDLNFAIPINRGLAATPRTLEIRSDGWPANAKTGISVKSRRLQKTMGGSSPLPFLAWQRLRDWQRADFFLCFWEWRQPFFGSCGNAARLAQSGGTPSCDGQIR